MSSQANVVEYGFLTSDSNLDPFASTLGTDKQYTVVKLNGDQVTPVTAIADVAFGILTLVAIRQNVFETCNFFKVGREIHYHPIAFIFGDMVKEE